MITAQLANRLGRMLGSFVECHCLDVPTRFRSVRDARVRKLEIFPDRNAENFRGLGGFSGARGSRAACAHLALSEVEDPGTAALAREFGESTAGVQLGVVAVGEYCKNID